MKLMIIGASKGLGKAFTEGLAVAGDTVIGVSRKKPAVLEVPQDVTVEWIEADLSTPASAVDDIMRHCPLQLDAVIYNLGIWESKAFEEDYAFLDDSELDINNLITVNITSALLLLKRLIPRLLTSVRPQLILTGSTSALTQSGRPEVAFTASKFALRGMAEALRESFRHQQLAVTCLQLGYLNTEDGLAVPLDQAALRGEGELIPVHDVVSITRTLLTLSPSSFVKEIILPAIRDPRF